MATRGRTNTSKTPTKSKVAAKPKATKKEKATKKTSKLNTALGIGKSLLGLGGKAKKGGGGVSHKNTAKNMLRKAYEKRAKRQIRFGQLGQARRTLRKKTTIV